MKEERTGLFANLENLSKTENVAIMKCETEQEEQEVRKDIVQEECLLLRSSVTPAAISCTKPWGFGRLKQTVNHNLVKNKKPKKVLKVQ